MSDALNAHVVLHKLAQALPKKHHSNIIIVGSLSAAAQLIQDADTELRTKDILKLRRKGCPTPLRGA